MLNISISKVFVASRREAARLVLLNIKEGCETTTHLLDAPRPFVRSGRNLIDGWRLTQGLTTRRLRRQRSRSLRSNVEFQYLPGSWSDLDQIWWLDVGWPHNYPEGVTGAKVKVTGVKHLISVSQLNLVWSWWNLVDGCRLTAELPHRGYWGKGQGQGHWGQISNFNVSLAHGLILTKFDSWM